MRYELFLRRDKNAAPMAEELVDAARSRAAALSLRFDVFVGEGGATRGFDLGIDLEEHPRRSRELFDAAFELSRVYELMVFDPQLGRLLSPTDGETMEARFSASSEIGRVGLYPEDSSGVRPAMSRLWLVVAALVVLLLVAGRLLTCWL